MKSSEWGQCGDRRIDGDRSSHCSGGGVKDGGRRHGVSLIDFRCNKREMVVENI